MRLRIIPFVSLALFPISCTPTPAPLVLGHVATLGAADRIAADQEVNGIRLALTDHAASGTADASARPVVVRHADDLGKSENVEGQAVRLVSVNRAVALLGGADPAAAQSLAEAGVPVVATVGGESPRLRDRVLTTGLSAEVRGKALAGYLKSRAKSGSVLVLTDTDDEEARRSADAFLGAWKEGGGPNATREPVPGEVGGWESALKKVGVDALLVVASAPTRFRELAELSAATDRPLAFAGPELARQELRERTGPLYLVTAYAPGKESPKAEAFARQYQEKFKAAAGPHAALAYENARLAFELLRKGPPPVAKLREEAQKLKTFAGLFGDYTVSGLALQRPAFVGRWEKGALQDVERYPAAGAKE